MSMGRLNRICTTRQNVLKCRHVDEYFQSRFVHASAASRLIYLSSFIVRTSRTTMMKGGVPRVPQLLSSKKFRNFLFCRENCSPLLTLGLLTMSHCYLSLLSMLTGRSEVPAFHRGAGKNLAGAYICLDFIMSTTPLRQQP